MPSKKKKYNARFPAGRIKKIMQTDEEVGKVAQAVPVIISRTLELFVGSLLTKAMQITSAKNAKTLSPSHMKQCILSEQRFDFLKDLVKTVQDSANGEEEMPAAVVPNLLPPGPNKSVPERRKSSSGFVEEENIFKEEVDMKEEIIKEPYPVVANCSTLHLNPNYYSETNPEQRVSIPKPTLYQPTQMHYSESATGKMEELDMKEEIIKERYPVVANCSTLHLSPNLYSETSPEQRVSVHKPPLCQPTQITYQESATASPILVMDEDYDT